MSEPPDSRIPVAVLGTGNIGSDLMLKLERSTALRLSAMVGIDPDSRGLREAQERGHRVSADGVGFLLENPGIAEVVFDATSAAAHVEHVGALHEAGYVTIDLTPAGLGSALVPTVNAEALDEALDVSLISCGAQATIPIVAGVSRVAPVRYAEVVVTISSLSAGPGTRQNIDEFTACTRRGILDVGGAAEAKAIIILNPAEPPIDMRNTVICELEDDPPEGLAQSVLEAVAAVQAYVPGYRLQVEPQVDGRVVKVAVSVEGAGDFLPSYAGNLDIMTAAAVKVGELVGARRRAGAEA